MYYTYFIYIIYLFCAIQEGDRGILVATLGYHKDAMLKDIRRSTAGGGSRDQGFDMAGCRAFRMSWPGYFCMFRRARVGTWLRRTACGAILRTSRSSLRLGSLNPPVPLGCSAHLCFLPALLPLVGDDK